MITALTLTCGVLAMLVNLTPEPPAPGDSTRAGADSSVATTGPIIGDLVFAIVPATADSLSWWPPGLEDALLRTPLVLEARERGLGCRASCEFAPAVPGIVWHGLPLEWPLELGGDVSPAAGAACSELSTGRSPPWFGGGLGTVRIAPWEDIITSPVTSVQMLRGDHNDRSYAVGLSTGVTSSVFSLISVALSKGDGARTNADYSRTQYDVRLDLRPPVLGACRVTAHRGRVDRGDPGPDPRLWASTASDDPLHPSFWAIARDRGAFDAMWSDDREALTRDLIALQFERPLRDRTLRVAVLEEGLDVDRLRSVPRLEPAPVLDTVRGELSSRRRALLASIPLMAADEESLWAGVSLEQRDRSLALAWTREDSAWSERTDDDAARVALGLGIGVPGVSATVTAMSTDHGSAVSWGCVATRDLSGIRLEAGAAGGADERRLEDLWLDRLAGVDESPPDHGSLGTAWLILRRESLLGELAMGGVSGWGSGVWGWCEPESLPPGCMRRWGPSSARAAGVMTSWRAAFGEGLEMEARAQALPWREEDDPLPRWPEASGFGRIGIRHALGRAAVPRLDFLLRYVGQRYAGSGGALPLEAYWQLDGQAVVEIGDFAFRAQAENLTGGRHEDERGYPVEGLRFRTGFTWVFWD